MWMKSNNQKSICGWQYVGWVWWGGGCSDGKSAGVTIQNISIQCSHIQSTVPVCCSIINLLFIVGTASSIKHKNKQGKKTPSDLVLVQHLLSWCCWAFKVLYSSWILNLVLCTLLSPFLGPLCCAGYGVSAHMPHYTILSPSKNLTVKQ